MGQVRIGTSGWVYKGWNETFYPADVPRRAVLQYMAERVSSVEVNGSFYSLQRPESYQRWYGQTAFDFIPRDGEPRRYEAGVPSGLRFEADEVARCLERGLLESPLMPLDETVSIMETMDEVLAQAVSAPR